MWPSITARVSSTFSRVRLPAAYFFKKSLYPRRTVSGVRRSWEKAACICRRCSSVRQRSRLEAESAKRIFSMAASALSISLPFSSAGMVKSRSFWAMRPAASSIWRRGRFNLRR